MNEQSEGLTITGATKRLQIGVRTVQRRLDSSELEAAQFERAARRFGAVEATSLLRRLV